MKKRGCSVIYSVLILFASLHAAIVRFIPSAIIYASPKILTLALPAVTHSKPNAPDCAHRRQLDGIAFCGNKKIQLFIVYDVSAGFYSYINVYKKTITSVYDTMKELGAAFTMGIGYFTDKPIDGLGDPSSDSCFTITTPLTAELQHIDTLPALRLGNGGDVKESQLEALYHAAKSDKVGWSKPDDNSFLRVIVLVTDSLYHTAGDAVAVSPSVESHGDSADFSSPHCETTDYPSESQVLAVLKENDIHVVFLIPSFKVDSSSEILSSYRSLADRMSDGRDGIVARYGSDEDSLATAIVASIYKLSCASSNPDIDIETLLSTHNLTTLIEGNAAESSTSVPYVLFGILSGLGILLLCATGIIIYFFGCRKSDALPIECEFEEEKSDKSDS